MPSDFADDVRAFDAERVRKRGADFRKPQRFFRFGLLVLGRTLVKENFQVRPRKPFLRRARNVLTFVLCLVRNEREGFLHRFDSFGQKFVQVNRQGNFRNVAVVKAKACHEVFSRPFSQRPEFFLHAVFQESRLIFVPFIFFVLFKFFHRAFSMRLSRVLEACFRAEARRA